MARKKFDDSFVFPTIDQIEREISREKYNQKYKRVLKSTMASLVVVAAIAVLVATLALPVLQIEGSSMEPALNDEEIVVLLKTPNIKRGQLCCFSYQNKLLIKRVIGLPGDSITIRNDGTVILNGEELDEPYVIDKALGECDVEFPVNVTDNHYFILGDHRSTSIDSRNTAVGMISDDQIVGRIFFRIWPFKAIGLVG